MNRRGEPELDRIGPISGVDPRRVAVVPLPRQEPVGEEALAGLAGGRLAQARS